MIDHIQGEEQEGGEQQEMENGLTAEELRLTREANDHDEWEDALIQSLSKRNLSKEDLSGRLKAAFVEKEKMTEKDFDSYKEQREERGLSETEPDPRMAEHEMFAKEYADTLKQFKDRELDSNQLRIAQQELETAETQLRDVATLKIESNKNTRQLTEVDRQIESLKPQLEGKMNAVKRALGLMKYDDANMDALQKQQAELKKTIASLQTEIQKIGDVVAEKRTALQEKEKGITKELNSADREVFQKKSEALRKQMERLASEISSDGYNALVAHAEFFVSTPEQQEQLDSERRGRMNEMAYDSDVVNPSDRRHVVGKVKTFIDIAKERGDI